MLAPVLEIPGCYLLRVAALIAATVLCSRPKALSWDQVVRLSPVERLDHAFTVAKDQLAIERLLDPEGTVTRFYTFPFCPHVLYLFVDYFKMNILTLRRESAPSPSSLRSRTKKKKNGNERFHTN